MDRAREDRDTVDISAIYGHYEQKEDSLWVWVPNRYMDIPADKQFSHNLSVMPGFSLVRTEPL